MRKTSIIRVLLIVLTLSSASLWGQRSTTYTYTPNPKGEGFYTRTGDAYLPEFTLTNLGLKNPQDLYIDSDDLMYIADTGNKRVVFFDISRGEITGALTNGEFVSPSSVWLDRNDVLYVADPKAKKVFCFDTDYQLIRTYERPIAAAFGDRDFAPRKVAVDDSGSLYIIGEGLYDGVIQLSPQGTFLGYFTSNKVDLSFVERLQDLLFTDAQKANLLDRTPITFSNLYIDQKNILYTTSIGKDDSVVKKHNAAGAAIVTGAGDEDAAPLDLWVTEDGIIVAVFNEGQTVIYTREGDTIATWGYSYERRDVVGLFEKPVSVAMDSKGALWYLDEELNFLQSYTPTEYIQNIYEALDLFESGRYEQSIEVWKKVLEVNQVSRLAHLSIGKNYLFMRDYDRAMYHTKIANSRSFYSDSFWEIRNIWLQKNVLYIVFAIFFLFIAGPLYRFTIKRLPSLKVVEKPFHVLAAVPFLAHIRHMFFIMRHPVDGFYYLRKGERGSFPAAIVILLGFFFIFMLFSGGKGFIYQEVLPEDIDFLSIALGFFGGILLFLYSNYLGTSIHDGRGDMRDLVMMFSYSLAPLILAMGVSIGASYVLTLNEVFVLELLMMVGWAWWFIQVILGLKEIHEYETRQAIGSIVYSIAFMAIFLILAVIVLVMGQQVLQFFTALIKELTRNVL
jgi:tetratricopeptide (TPR) repeat protein